MAWARAWASVAGTFNRKWARRVAVLGPIPGRRESSPTNRARGSDIGMLAASLRSEQTGQARCHRSHLALHRLFHPPPRLVDGGDDQVLEHRGVLAVHHLRIDLDRDELLVAAHLDRHHAAADTRLDDRLGELALQALLHLLSLFHQLTHTAHLANPPSSHCGVPPPSPPGPGRSRGRSGRWGSLRPIRA